MASELKELLPSKKLDVNNIGPASTIFTDISKDSPKDDKKNEKGPNKNIQLKEFFWDQFLIYIATGIALLTVLNATIQFFQSSGNLQCYVPMDVLPQEFTRDNAAYVNTFCLGSLTWSEYYSVFILIQGILVVAPHYLWSSIFSGRFDFFVDLVKQLDRLRDSDTGDYRPENIYLVNKLEQEFPEKWKWTGIFALYCIKLSAQLVIIALSLVINVSVFPQENFPFVFPCPHEFNSSSNIVGWSLPFAVFCSYPSFRVLSRIQIVDYILLVLGLLPIVYGLFWCVKRHPSSLGYKQVADFAFASCLSAEEFVSESLWKKPWKITSPRIKNDLDFLVMRLFRADSGHGRVFKDIQVSKEIKRQSIDDHVLLHQLKDAIDDQKKALDSHQGARMSDRSHDIIDLLKKAGFDEHPKALENVYSVFKEDDCLGDIPFKPVASLRNRLFEFFQFTPGHEMAYSISFGTAGFALILARVFKEVISVNFHPFYHNAKEVVKKELFQVNYSKITVQQDIFAQRTDSLKKTDNAIDDFFRDMDHKLIPTKKINFIIVGPFIKEATRGTVNLHIERMNNAKRFGKNAILLAVRPMMIAGKDVSKHFCKYNPAKQLFKEANPTDSFKKNLYPVTCAGVHCVFEFTTYNFLKRQEVILSRSSFQHPKPKNTHPQQSPSSAHEENLETANLQNKLNIEHADYC